MTRQPEGGDAATDALLLARLVAAPDAARTRAMSMAALLGTATSVVVTGLVFSSTRPESRTVSGLALLTLLSLTLSVACFTWAGQHTRTGDDASADEMKSEFAAALKTIASRTRVGAWLAVVALLLSLAVAGWSVLAPPATKQVTVVLAPQALAAVQVSCPRFLQGAHARIAGHVASGSSPLMAISVAASDCRGDGLRTELVLRRTDVTLLTGAS